MEHIAKTSLEEVWAFFRQFYVPNNAVLVVAGGVTYENVKQLSEKWFAPIPPGRPPQRTLPQEPPQRAPRSGTVVADVPLAALYKAYHVPGRLAQGYCAAVLLADVLGSGKSARLYATLVEARAYFNAVEVHMTETADPGLCVISGTLNSGVTFKTAEQALEALIKELQEQPVVAEELVKVRHLAEADRVFAAVDLLDRAQELALATVLGNTNLVNEEVKGMAGVCAEDVQRAARCVLAAENCSTIYYQRRA